MGFHKGNTNPLMIAHENPKCSNNQWTSSFTAELSLDQARNLQIITLPLETCSVGAMYSKKTEAIPAYFFTLEYVESPVI